VSALLGQNVDASVAHFRKKVDDSVPESAEILVGLLTRLGRYTEALDISMECLGDEAGSTCPSAIQQQQPVTKPHL